MSEQDKVVLIFSAILMLPIAIYAIRWIIAVIWRAGLKRVVVIGSGAGTLLLIIQLTVGVGSFVLEFLIPLGLGVGALIGVGWFFIWVFT